MKALFKTIIRRILEHQVSRLFKRHQVRVVAITGSVGKTSTKQAVAKVLEKKFSTLYHEGNYNSEIGLPMAIFEQSIPDDITDIKSWLTILLNNQKKIKSKFPYQIAVLEMGADHPGDIGRFMRYIKPEVGILTAIAPAHTEGFGSVEAILEEKWKLVTSSKRALVNTDFNLIADKLTGLRNNKIGSYGLSAGDYHYDSITNLGIGGWRVSARLKKQMLSTTIKTPAKHMLLNFLAAQAVGEIFEVNAVDIKSAIESTDPTPGRMNILKGVNETTLIDDAYNSNPAALLAALEALYSYPGKKKIGIIGSMNELGEDAKFHHEQLGAKCTDLDYLVVIGSEASNWLLPAALEAGLAKDKAASFSSPDEAGKFVKGIINPGDIILIKGSQNGVFAEEATKQLLDNPSDIESLVRQSDDWMAKKLAQFPKISLQ